MPNPTRSINIFRGSEYYSDLLDSFYSKAALQDGDIKDISEAIYFHICKMKYAGWRHRVRFKRARKHSFSEFFQDIIAFYLKAALPKQYKVELEHKGIKTHPDIAIKRGNKVVFLIEVKTNIGWDRINQATPRGRDSIKRIESRVNQLHEEFKVPKNNIIYILEDPGNVGKKFSAKFWDGKHGLRPDEDDFPFSKIYPLFDQTDPFYWPWGKGEKRFDKTMDFRKLSDEQIQQEAKSRIVTPFVDIIKMIRNNC